MEKLQEEIGTWSKETFGNKNRTIALLTHVKSELDEAIGAYEKQSRYFDFEIADVFILMLDIMDRNNIPMSRMRTAIMAKMEINKRREWNEPDENGVITKKV